MRYIINNEGKVIGSIRMGEINAEDMESRGDFIVSSDLKLPLKELEYKDGKIIKHTKTIEEIKEDERISEENIRNKKITARMYKIAEDQLIDEGEIEPIEKVSKL